MYINCTKISEIKSRNDIVDVISETDKLNLKGNNYWGLCPFHQEKTPSLCVNRDKQMYYCYGCHVGGDVIDFIRRRLGIEFNTAVEILASRARIVLAQESREVILSARKKREEEQKAKNHNLEIIKTEWLRLINIEKLCHMFISNIRTVDCLNRPGPLWALHTLPRVEDHLNRLERSNYEERLLIALEAQEWKS